MATFDELRLQLRDRRNEAETARQAASAAREHYERLKARGAAAAEIDRARVAAEAARAEAVRTRNAELRGTADFGAVADPRTAIGALKDRTPILMFPVRIETRFQAGPPPQLLVRVYPDDCLVDTFEPMLSEDEVKAARLYWQGIWAAGGYPPQQRGPWRQLVNTSGAGRAQWVLLNYFPVRRDLEPKKDKPTDIILVIVAGDALPAEEERPATDYWTSVWRAGENRAEVEAARKKLVDKFGAARADALIAATRPVNFDVKPEPPLTRATVGMQTKLLILPPPEGLSLKRRSWSGAARSVLLPDRFVFIGYNHDGTPPLEVLGAPVLAPFVVGPDPSAPEEEQLRQDDDGRLIFPDDMQWMVDFNRAVASGMGFRIPLSPAQALSGFARVIVAGVRLASDHQRGQQELETLLGHHRFSRTGLAVLPQGTPTNNTDTATSGHSRIEDADVSFDEMKRGNLWTPTSKWDEKSDGQWLAELLGLNDSALQQVHGSDGRDLAEARAMSSALWPSTVGRWLEIGVRDRVVPAAALPMTRAFFTDFVSGRGPLPAIRIGSQPYGILPATPWSKTQWFAGVDADLEKLYPVLSVMASDWRGLVPQVSFVGGGRPGPQALLDIVAAHPGSVEHTWRIARTLDETPDPAMALLARLGYTGTAEPDFLLNRFDAADVPLGPGVTLIDDRPLSETAAVRVYTTDGKNYLGWLFGAAPSADALRDQQGFKDGKLPLALLYKYLWTALRAGHRDPAYLPRQIAAVKRLENLPTARLERLFTEHLDCCAYRVDAWLIGAARKQLVRMRNIVDSGTAATNKGIYLGAYAWVERLRPDRRVLEPAEIDPAVAADFPPLAPPLLTDRTNSGYIHAPSLNHAVTAAVLRNGYISNADRDRPDMFAVNLSSERVRVAMSILEGLRNGQSMGALLGYQFERGLHDRHEEELDKFILSVRLAFPLASNRLASTNTSTDSIEKIEARNVVDGLALVNAIRLDPIYPFGYSLLRGTPEEEAALSAEAERLVATWDAVADLAISEGVFQAVLGNFDRVGATLDALSKGYVPPEPQIVRTPVEGTGITHRVAVHLKPGLAPEFSPVHRVDPTPRSLAEPAVNEWIASVLPPLDDIVCVVRFRDGRNDAKEESVTLRDLSLQPVDVVRLAAGVQEELDERITTLVADRARPDAPVTIAFMEKTPRKLSLFEVLPLIRHLHRLTRAARPLAPTDLARPNDAKTDQNQSVFADRQRIQKALDALNQTKTALEAFLATVVAQSANAAANCDDWIAKLPQLFGRAALFGIPQSGWSFAYEFRKGIFIAVRTKAAEVVERWDRRLADHDALIAKYEALPSTATNAERFALLTRAESTVSTTVTAPLPPTPQAYFAAVRRKRKDLADRRDQFAALRDSTKLTVKDLLAQFAALLPVTQFDLAEISTKSEVDRCATFAQDVQRVVKVLIADADARGKAAAKLLQQHDGAATATARVDALTAAGKALLGDDFAIVPELTVGAAAARELASAHAGSSSMLTHAAATTPLPVDSWLYGVARVRERMRDWEQLVLFAGALGSPEPELTPLQLPFRTGDSWMALDFPATMKLEQERLLYTAHFRQPFDPSKRQCGLLVDEWTEVIPSDGATSGVAVHYDRPNNEAPQTMLLLTPPLTPGAWQWKDVVDALSETLDLAKVRAVEPRHLDDTLYARILPATVLEDFS
ncbi:MAG TPA: hypothetical protein VF432_03680 [Thermoanaerobaculia bacterium]